MNLNQKGIAPIVLAIIVIAVLIIGIAIGYFINKFYVIEQPAAPATTSTPPPTDETANWKTYRNEEYRFEMKYPKDWKVREVSSTNFLQAYGFEDFAKDTPIKFVAFKSPDTSTRKDFYYYLSFGLRRKGENILLSENTWKGLEKYARLGDSVKIGNIETKTTQFFIKDKPHEVLYSDDVKTGIESIDGFEIRAELLVGESTNNMSADSLDNVDVRNRSEYQIANQILSTFKFIK